MENVNVTILRSGSKAQGKRDLMKPWFVGSWSWCLCGLLGPFLRPFALVEVSAAREYHARMCGKQWAISSKFEER